MKTFNYVVTNVLGIHARPAAMLAQACTNFKSAVVIEGNGEEAKGNDVLSILSLHAAKGTTLKFTITGEDEDEAMAKIQEVLKEVEPKDKPASILLSMEQKTMTVSSSQNYQKIKVKEHITSILHISILV